MTTTLELLYHKPVATLDHLLLLPPSLSKLHFEMRANTKQLQRDSCGERLREIHEWHEEEMLVGEQCRVA